MFRLNRNIIMREIKRHNSLKKKLIFLSVIFFSFGLNAVYTDENQSAVNQTKKYGQEDLNSLSFSNNPEILKLQEEYKMSLLDLQDARADIMPKIDFQASGTYLFNPPLGPVYVNADDFVNSLYAGQGIKPSSSGQYIKIYDGMEKTLYTIQASLTQPLFTWGKIYNENRLYSALSRVKLLQLESKQKEIQTQLEIRLSSLYYLYKIKEILDEEELYVDRLVDHAQKAEKSGMLLAQDVLDAKIKAKEIQIAKNDVEEQIFSQILELKKMTGLEDFLFEIIDFVPDEEKIASVLLMNKEELLEKALSANNKTMNMLNLLENVRSYSLDIAKASVNWKPDFAFQVTAGYGGSRLPFFEPNWFRKDDYNLNLSFGIKTTLFDGGKKINDVKRKTGELVIQKQSKEEARLEIQKTFNSKWNEAELCQMKIEYEDLKIETLESKVRQQNLILNTGYGSETEVLQSKISLCNEKIEKEKQKINKAISCLTILYLCE